MTDESAPDDPATTSLLRGALGVACVVVGVLWVASVAAAGAGERLLFELLPPLALTYLGVRYARRHLHLPSALDR